MLLYFVSKHHYEYRNTTKRYLEKFARKTTFAVTCDPPVFSLASDRFRGFSKKKTLNARGFAREFLRSGILYRPGKSLKRRGKSFSLHWSKNFLLGGCVFFVSDIISGGLLGHLGPLCLALGANH